jgi:LPS-assembly lipoprotein
MSMPAPRSLLIAAFLLFPTLTGCGFEPLYGERAGKGSVMKELAEVEIAPIQERVGQQIRNRLIDRMRGPGPAPAAKYRLLAETTTNRTDYGVALDSSPTFSTVSLVLRYSLLDASSGALVTSNAAVALVNFSSTTSPFSTLIGDENARRRAAEQVADATVTQLALFFSDRTNAPMTPPAILDQPFINRINP